ncbi:MAG: nickel pincer cofactor biosynthesis protein LarB, partial [Candidatus Aminicenantes bacterium]|nr:nickel pincer cofactor biosynthesis protein LarB [Candidatus Aminicenantes bacterium]
MTEKEKAKSELENQIRLLKSGKIIETDFLRFLRDLPYKDIGDIKLDLHRKLRRGLPEVIYGQDKNIDQLRKIIEHINEISENIIVTRVSLEKFQTLKQWFPDLLYHDKARVITFKKKPEIKFRSSILILTAGSSDEPVAEEAYITSLYLGNRVEKEYDVGVACISRVLDLREKLNDYGVIIVIAGMEGALPSVVAGLTSTPVIAVPTSIGYGASFNGLAALLSMLNSCSGGVSVVNIDNGFGAAYQATLIIQK